MIADITSIRFDPDKESLPDCSSDSSGLKIISRYGDIYSKIMFKNNYEKFNAKKLFVNCLEYVLTLNTSNLCINSLFEEYCLLYVLVNI